jgi:hypothetical protein
VVALGLVIAAVGQTVQVIGAAVTLFVAWRNARTLRSKLAQPGAGPTSMKDVANYKKHVALAIYESGLGPPTALIAVGMAISAVGAWMRV